jgi:hypothetical protein
MKAAEKQANLVENCNGRFGTAIQKFDVQNLQFL